MEKFSIQDIYKKYEIPAHLQMHHFRVAAVAKLIIDKFPKDSPKINENLIITACLLHDIGNIIKFNLMLYPELNSPRGYDYWKSVQDRFILKYGPDEHKATYMIAKEVGVDEKVLKILNSIGFSNSGKVASSRDYNLKITAYADQRVGIDGIMGMAERHTEGRNRYLKRNNASAFTSPLSEFNTLAEFLKDIEKDIFSHTKIRPEDITDMTVAPVIEELKNFMLNIKR